jgi:hypothetical protein
MSFSPLQVTFLPLKKIEKEIEFGDINVIPTSEAKCFHKRVITYNPCKCTTSDLQETIIEHH